MQNYYSNSNVAKTVRPEQARKYSNGKSFKSASVVFLTDLRESKTLGKKSKI